MFVRKTLLLASIAAIGVSVATAQQAGVNSQIAAGALSDPFSAPPLPRADAASPAKLQADVEALAFGATSTGGVAPTSSLPKSGTWAAPAFGMPTPVATAPAPFIAANSSAIGTAAAPTTSTPPANPFAPVRASTLAATGGTAKTRSAAETNKEADDTALRYYASQRDLVRVGAEIRRLKTLYPDWLPPSDLFAPRGGADEQPLWALFAKGQFAEIEAEIERIKTEKPGWTPTDDLMTKLQDGKARQAVTSAAAAGNWADAIAAAQERPSLLVCGSIDVLWNVGESFARMSEMARAYDLYAYVLANCDSASERLATFQKANALLPAQGTTALLAYSRTLPNGLGEFDSQRFDTLRQRMSEVGSGKTSQLPPTEELQAYVDYVRRSRSAPDMGLIGWYFFGQENWQRAAEWFQAGVESGGDAKLTEGYILALRNGDRVSDAEEIAFQNYRSSPEIAKIYVEMVADELTADEGTKEVSDKAMDRFEKIVGEVKSPLGAQSLGWHLVYAKDYPKAKDWFQRSVEWKPTEEGVVGLAVVATRLKQTGELKLIRAKYEAEFPAVAGFKDYTPEASKKATSSKAGPSVAGTAKRPGGRKGHGGGGDHLMAEANRLYKQGDYQGALQALDRREARSGKEYGAEILRGWTNHHLGRWDEARKVFSAQDKRRSTKDTRFGIGATSNSQYRMWSEGENKCKVWSKC